MLFHCLQTQAGIFSNFLVTSALAGQLGNFPFAPREPPQAWQAEKPKSPGSLAIPAKILARDKKMRARHAN
jgi:hypothetical protein